MYISSITISFHQKVPFLFILLIPLLLIEVGGENNNEDRKETCRGQRNCREDDRNREHGAEITRQNEKQRKIDREAEAKKERWNILGFSGFLEEDTKSETVRVWRNQRKNRKEKEKETERVRAPGFNRIEENR